MLCLRCGREVNDGDIFCPACGNKHDLNTLVGKKNIGVVLLLIALGIQLLAVVGSAATMLTETFSVGMQVFSTLSAELVFVTSIMCLVKSKTATNHSGRVLGIVFTVLSSISMFFILVSMFVTGIMLVQSVDDKASRHDDIRKEIQMAVRVDKIDEETQLAVNFATEQLFYYMDSCDSLDVRAAKVAALEEDVFVVYFKYSTEEIADNCCGIGVYKNDYEDGSSLGSTFKLVSVEDIDSIPDSIEHGELFSLDHNQINSYLKELILSE